MVRDKTYRIFLIAGEPSGDLLGSRLMRALRTDTKTPIHFEGIGGEHMEAEGLKSLFPLSDLTLFGVAEILPHIPKLLRRLKQTRTSIETFNPHAIITIDSPGFCFRLMKGLRSRKALRIHYTAPQVWAWAPWRAKKVAKLFDHLLTLFPFEPPYFTKEGLPATFVGHSLIESPLPPSDPQLFRKKHHIAPTAPLLCLLPGSRQSEVKTLLPVFKDVIALLRQCHPGLHLVLPLVPSVAGFVKENAASWNCSHTFVEKSEEKVAAMTASNCALTASGTVTLELARAQVPFVVAYKIHPLTAWLARYLIRVPAIALVNILAGRKVVPEILQKECTPDALSQAVLTLLEDPSAAQHQKEAFRGIIKQLHSPVHEQPSHAAAQIILRLLEEGK
jgi:lipid-A-disaccharide synthase